MNRFYILWPFQLLLFTACCVCVLLTLGILAIFKGLFQLIVLLDKMYAPILLCALLLPIFAGGQTLYTNEAYVYTNVTDYYYNAGRLPLGFSPATFQWMPPSASASLYSEISNTTSSLFLTNYGNSTVAFTIHLKALTLGRNVLIVTTFWPDPTSGLWVTNIVTNFIYRAGFKIWADTGTNTLYAVKAHLTDFTWFPETNSNPAWGDFSARQQFFSLAPRTHIEFYPNDTLPAMVIINTTNVVTTNLGAQTAPMPIP